MNLIKHIFSPSRLLLVWQAPDGGDRTRLAVGELRESAGDITFRYLSEHEDFHKARKLGFSCYPAFRKTDREYSEGVLDAFLRRVPPRSRNDFPRFLAQWRLGADADLSAFALLAYCGAKLPSDGFSLVWPLEDVTAPGEVLLEIAGFRYQGVSLEELSLGMPIRFVPEPDNEKDSKALRVEIDGRTIGYINRFQRDAVTSWLDLYDVHASIERFNGTSDRPLVYVFCRVVDRRAAAVG